MSAENSQGYKTEENTVPAPGDIPVHTQVEHEKERPGLQTDMGASPISDALPNERGAINEKGMPGFSPYIGSNKLLGRKALVTGGDSGIGKAVAIFFAIEGADVAINYLPAEQKDAEQTKKEIEEKGGKCVLIPGNIGYEHVCIEVISKVLEELGGIDILVNNTAEQHFCDRLEDLTGDQLIRTFRSNIFSMFLLTKHALPCLGRGSTIVNTTSVVAYRGSSSLVDYGATKGAIVSFTRCLAKQVASRGIRVNCVAPGPVYTPLQEISRPEEGMDEFANESSNLLGRVGQPSEIASSFVFLASNDSSQFTGQCLHPNGGEVYNS